LLIPLLFLVGAALLLVLNNGGILLVSSSCLLLPSPLQPQDNIVLMFVVISKTNGCSLLYSRLMATGLASWKRDSGTESTGVLTAPLRRMRCGVDMVVYAYMYDIRPSSRIRAEKRG
jgi:hypothetical protein